MEGGLRKGVRKLLSYDTGVIWSENGQICRLSHILLVPKFESNKRTLAFLELLSELIIKICQEFIARGSMIFTPILSKSYLKQDMTRTGLWR